MEGFFIGLRGIPLIAKYLITAFIGMVPIIEIRGAIPLGVAMDLSYIEAYIAAFIGNIIPNSFNIFYTINQWYRQ